MPTISINKTDGCHVYLSKKSLDCEIVSAKSSEMNVLVPTDSGDFVSLFSSHVEVCGWGSAGFPVRWKSLRALWLNHPSLAETEVSPEDYILKDLGRSLKLDPYIFAMEDLAHPHLGSGRKNGEI